MSENKASQVQEVQGAWQKMVGDHVTRVEQAMGESARYQGQGFEAAKTAVDEWAKLSKDTFQYFGQLSTEWQKLSLEATRRATGLIVPEGVIMESAPSPFPDFTWPRPVALAPTPKDTIHRDGTAQLYRFRKPDGVTPAGGLPLLLVPSLINQWYVLDLRRGASMADSLTQQGIDTFCLDWGVPHDEDRYLTWDEVIDRLARAVRAVRRATGAPKVGLLGYCIGGTLASIYSALEPERVAALVNLAGPIDFSKAGFLGEMVDGRFFDAQAVADAGNVSALQMQSGFVALRPTAQLAKWVSILDRGSDPKVMESFQALEAWAGDNIPFPGAAYATYIRELYQQNLLIQGKHRVRGRAVELGAITCPVLSVVTDRDAICPAPAATALNEHVGSSDKEVLTVNGGHVGAVVGGKAPKVLYPALAAWFKKKLGATSVSASEAAS